jgi:hypothetical protein
MKATALAVLLLLVAVIPALTAQQEGSPTRPAIYNRNADGAKQIAEAIDVDQVDGNPHNADADQRYGHPTRFGLPVLVVLDSDG